MSASARPLDWQGRITTSPDRLVAHGQPILPATPPANDLTNVELLARWGEDEGKVLPASVFIPAAEAGGFIGTLDRLMLSRAVAAIRTYPDLVLWVNLSGTSIQDPHLATWFSTLGAVDPAVAHRLVVEITETAPVTDLANLVANVEWLRTCGVRLAIDDFGATLTTFQLLNTVPVDIIKVDGQFLDGDHALLTRLVASGHAANTLVVVERAEDHDQVCQAVHAGADYVQGYGVALPAPLADLEVPTALPPCGPAAHPGPCTP